MITTSTRFHEAACEPRRGMPARLEDGRNTEQRLELAEAVEYALAGTLLPSARHERLVQDLAASFTASQRERAESRTILAVDGPYAVGKTGAVLRWARQVHHDTIGSATGRMQPEWEPSPGVRADHVPVVWLRLKGRQDALGIYKKILSFFRHGTRGSSDDLEIAVAESLVQHGTKLLVIDDAHHINTRLEKGRATLDSVKDLNDMVSQAGGTLVFVGADLLDGDLLNDPQLCGRLEVPHTIRPYAAGTNRERAEWQRLLKATEELLRPYVDPDEQHPLLPHAALLWDRSQGHVRDLTRLIAQGTGNCIRRGGQSPIPSDFETVRLLKRAEGARARSTGRIGGRHRAS